MRQDARGSRGFLQSFCDVICRSVHRYHTVINKTLAYLVTARILGEFDESQANEVGSGVRYYSDHKAYAILVVKPADKLPGFEIGLPRTFNVDIGGITGS